MGLGRKLTSAEAVRKAEIELAGGNYTDPIYWDRSSVLTSSDWKKIAVFRTLHGREPTPKELLGLLKK